jgi:hypothetical protein
MAWKRCCCSCVIHKDEFDRSPGTPLRGGWCEIEGDYEIDSSRAKCLVAEALAILRIKHPVPESRMFVHFKTVNENEDSGERYRILLNVSMTPSGDPVVCSNASYYFAEFERNGISDSVIRLGVGNGGSESIIKEDDVIGLTGTTRTFTAMIDENIICAGVDGAVLSQVATSHAGFFDEGYYSGFSLSAEDMLIDDFTFERKDSKGTICASCLCTCGDTAKEWPETLNVRIYPDPDDCDRLDLLDPCEFEIVWNRVSGVWEGSASCCEGDEIFDLEVACSVSYYEGEGNALSLGINLGCINSHNGNDVAVQDCDTLCATFGPFFVSATDITCLCSSIPFDLMNPNARGSCNFYVEVCE